MNLRARLSTLIALRLVVSTLLLGAAVLMELRGAGSYPVNPYFFLIGVTYALSIVYVATLRQAERHTWWMDVQLALDATLVAAFILVTGGSTSYFSALSFLPIIAASRIRFRRGALQTAAFTSLCYLGLTWMQFNPAASGALGALIGVSTASAGVAGLTLAINLFGFFAVAWLAGSLAEGWRTAGASLERASSAMADLREFNDLVINNLLSGVATADEHARVVSFNRAASAITGLDVSEAVGQPLVELFQLSAEARADLAKLEPMKTMRAEVAYCRPSGERIEMGVTATTLAFPDGRLGYLVAFQDVTEVRRLERQARMQQRLAAVGEMAAGIAHEIRNPLASMSGSIQVLRQDLELNDEQAQLMDIVLRESDRLNETIRSFLTYARPQRFALTRLDLTVVVRDVATLLRHSPEIGAEHRIEVDTPAAPVWCEADDTQVRQVLWNLASNGVRAMPAGGRLRLSARTEGDGSATLQVEDEGRGMRPDELDTLFQPFVSSFAKGTGLGLAIVHRIVQEYGGTIEVSSEPGRGTVFCVRLPQRATKPLSLDEETLGVAV